MNGQFGTPPLPWWLVACLAASLTGCMAIAQPRFPPDVAAAIRREPMRRMESPDLVVYYPDGRQAEAERFSGWVSGCIRELQARTRIHGPLARRKPFVILAGAPLDNAFVMPPVLGFETASVVTGYTNWDPLLEINSAPDPALFGCHEMVHWVHVMQMAGVWGWINRAFGSVMSPQAGLDPWVHEGLATYYESRLQPGSGRMLSPLWQGAFHAGVAGRRLRGGDLSFANRAFMFGNHYLVGSRFIEFLAERYGEEKLWRLVETQGRAIFFPLWVSLRFWQVYDKNLSTLLDEFADEVAARHPVRARPAGQRPLRRLGYGARYAVGRDGSEAIIDADHDQPLRLSVYGPGGERRARRSLTEVGLPRQLVDPGLNGITGLSLTADGQSVYFALTDQGMTFRRVRLIRYHLPSDRLQVMADDLGGPGGAVTDDGRAFLFARAGGDRHHLCELDLASGRERTINAGGPGVFLGSPRPSPDGRLLVATAVVHNLPRLVLFDRASGQPLSGEIRLPGPVADPWFLADGRLLFVGQVEGGYQVFLHDVALGTTAPVTRAPYLAIAPRPGPAGKLRFLNREGWGWTLDEATLPAAARPLAPVTTAAPESEPPPPSGSGPALAAGPAAEPRPPGPALPPPSPLVVIESDQPYSAFERLFIPQLHGLGLAALPDSGRAVLGLALGGGDRLSLHRWALNVYFDAGEPEHEMDTQVSGSVGYANSQLAPFTLRLQASRYAWWDRAEDVNEGPFTVDRRQRELELSLEVPFLTHRAGLALHATEQKQAGDPRRHPRRRLSGASASLGLEAVETTPYTGLRRGLLLSLDGAVYPDALGSQGFSFGDLRAGLFGRAPVPPFARLLATLHLRARTLAGAPRGSGFLEVGGGGPFGEIFSASSEAERPERDEDLSPLPLRFREPLRGFEDFPLALERVVMAEARLGYPLIVDRGFASSLVLLPSFFVRQLDFEAFADSAWDTRSARRSSLHAAGGAAITLRTVFWLAPLALRYQVARRLLDDRAWVHSVGLAIL